MAHLHFVWLILVATIAAIPLTILQATFHVFNPSAENFKRWAGLWSRICLASGGIRLAVRNEADLSPSQSYVFICNHQTGLDIWANLVGIDHAFGFVAKESLRKVPIMGQALRYSACLFVDRSTARKAVKSIAEAAERIKSGNSVLIYPEGMRTWSPTTVDFMRGAYQLAVKAGVPIVPVVLMNAYEVYDERSKTSKPGTVDMVIGEPIETSGTASAAIPEVVSSTRAWIQDALDRYHAPDAHPFITESRSVSSPTH